MTVNFRMDVNSHGMRVSPGLRARLEAGDENEARGLTGSQLCLNFSRYFSGLQPRLYGWEYIKRKSTFPLSPRGPQGKEGTRRLLFMSKLGQMKDVLHDGNEWFMIGGEDGI